MDQVEKLSWFTLLMIWTCLKMMVWELRQPSLCWDKQWMHNIGMTYRSYKSRKSPILSTLLAWTLLLVLSMLTQDIKGTFGSPMLPFLIMNHCSKFSTLFFQDILKLSGPTSKNNVQLSSRPHFSYILKSYPLSEKLPLIFITNSILDISVIFSKDYY